MDINGIIKQLRSQDPTLAVMIDALSDNQRIELRNAATKAGIKALPRNLYFNYATQQWITCNQWPSIQGSQS